MTAHKSEWPAGTGQSAKQTTQHRDSRPDQQRIANIRARAGMANVQFHVFDDECTGQTVFMVSRWAMTRQLESLDAAEKWLNLVCGVRT